MGGDGVLRGESVREKVRKGQMRGMLKGAGRDELRRRVYNISTYNTLLTQHHNHFLLASIQCSFDRLHPSMKGSIKPTLHRVVAPTSGEIGVPRRAVIYEQKYAEFFVD